MLCGAAGTPASSSSLCGVASLVQGGATTPAITSNQDPDMRVERGPRRKEVKEAASLPLGTVLGTTA